MLGLQGNRVWGGMWQIVVWVGKKVPVCFGKERSRTGSHAGFSAAASASSCHGGLRRGPHRPGFPLRHRRREETGMQGWRGLRSHTLVVTEVTVWAVEKRWTGVYTKVPQKCGWYCDLRLPGLGRWVRTGVEEWRPWTAQKWSEGECPHKGTKLTSTWSASSKWTVQLFPVFLS